jgi:hypothetical protein
MAQRFTYFQIQDTTTDLSMVAWPYADHDEKSTRAVVYFDKPVPIDGDLWVGMLDEELTKWVLDGTEPPGRNYVPTRQYTGGYAFIRTNPPASKADQGDFDPDTRLRSAIALSRLVHPTSVCFDHSVRIRTWGKPRDQWQLVPHTEAGTGEHAFVLDVNENWLIPADISAIADLIKAWNPTTIPTRVGMALWHHEMAARNYYSDIRWPLLVTGLESLVRIKNEKDKKGAPIGSTRAFVSRLAAIGRLDPSLAVIDPDLRAMYEKRSDLVHALALVAMDESTKALYRKLDGLVRGILRKAILNPVFAALFATDQSISTAFPV